MTTVATGGSYPLAHLQDGIYDSALYFIQSDSVYAKLKEKSRHYVLSLL